jgi:hypothetical protein
MAISAPFLFRGEPMRASLFAFAIVSATLLFNPSQRCVADEGEAEHLVANQLRFDGWGPIKHLLSGRMAVQRDLTHVRGDYELVVEIQNHSAHRSEIVFDPKNLKVEVFDAKDKVVSPPTTIIRSGPMPQPIKAIISSNSYVGLNTHRGGIPFGGEAALFAAGWQHWHLSPGKYTVRGTVKIALTHGEENLEPLAPGRSHPQWQEKGVLELGEKKLVTLDLGLTKFEIAASDQSKEQHGWSEPVNGLQARLELVEKPRLHGVRWLVPYLELRNVRDLANPMAVACDRPYLNIELVNSKGEKVDKPSSMSRSGSIPMPGTISLPMDSQLRFSLECRNWGIPKGIETMVSTDSGAWTFAIEDNSKYFIRAKLSVEETQPNWKQWHGELETPLVPVEWK